MFVWAAGRLHGVVTDGTEPARRAQDVDRTSLPIADARGARIPSVWRMTDHGAPLPATPRGPLPPPGPAGPTTTLAVRPAETPLGRFWEGYRTPATAAQLVGIAVVGLTAAVLVVGHRPGLGVAVVGAAAWAPAVPALVRRRAVGDLLLALVSVALLATVALRDAGWLVALCAVVAAACGAVAVTSARSTGSILLSGATWAAGLVRALPWVTRTVAYATGPRRRQALVALRSVAITAGLLLVFGLLFASADRVFASYLPRLSAELLPGQVVVGVMVAVLTAALAHLAVAPPSWSELRPGPGRPARRGEWLLPVLALDVLVLGFVLVQVGALVGGHDYVRATAGLGYAEYAREGFAQLVVATALTLAVVGVAARHAPRGTTRDGVVSRVALGVLCVATLGVVASALRRMDLYMEAFGLTRLRLLVVVVEVVLAAVLVLVMVAGLRRGSEGRPFRAAWLPRAVVVTVAAGMLGLVAVNPDALILRHNTTADLEVALDTDYLRGLSADAVPAADGLDEPLRSCVLDVLALDVPASTGLGDWNLSRVLAADVLEAGAPVEADGETCGYGR